MSKLLKLKAWLTLDEAANQLSNVLGEPITLADLYRLALDGHIRLSALFVNGAKAKRVKLVKSEDVVYKIFVPNIPDFPKGKCFRIPQHVETQISKDYWIQEPEPEVVSISGVWDLAMIGAERADITNRYYKETSNHSVKVPMSKGHYLQKDGETYQIQVRQERLPESLGDVEPTPSNIMQENEVISFQEMLLKMRPRSLPCYAVASKLSDYEHILVLRKSEINRFILSLEDAPQDKVLSTNEKNSLLVLLAALCKEADVDWNQRGIAGSLVAMTDLVGAPLSDETIRKILKQIDPALESRSK